MDVLDVDVKAELALEWMASSGALAVLDACQVLAVAVGFDELWDVGVATH